MSRRFDNATSAPSHHKHINSKSADLAVQALDSDRQSRSTRPVAPSNRTMKLFALLSTFVVACTALKSPVLSVPRGGATSIGPLDGAMAMKLAKTATGAYVAGSASKLVNKHTGGNDSVVSVEPRSSVAWYF